MSPQDQRYVYGYSREEFERLAKQNALWREDTMAHWNASGLGPDDTVFEIGCGPGFVTADLAGHVRQVLALDRDKDSLDSLRLRCIDQRLSNVTILDPCDARQLPHLSEPISAAYLRWVLCYLGPAGTNQVMARLAEQMEVGARVMVHDYINYRSTSIFPPIKDFSAFIDKSARGIEERGGDPSIGFHLPGIFANHGFEVTHTRLVPQCIRPGTPIWDWADEYFRLHLPSLMQRGCSSDQIEDFLTAWERSSQDPATILYGWPVLQITAEKR